MAFEESHFIKPFVMRTHVSENGPWKLDMQSDLRLTRSLVLFYIHAQNCEQLQIARLIHGFDLCLIVPNAFGWNIYLIVEKRSVSFYLSPLLLLLYAIPAPNNERTVNTIYCIYDLRRKQYHRRRFGTCIIPPI